MTRSVMAGLDPAIHVLDRSKNDVDARVKPAHDEGESDLTTRQRIDKWLHHARVVRTRTSAATLVEEGHVRLNGERVSANSHPLKAGDVVTIALDRTVRVMKVTGFAERRGDATAASRLFEDLTPRPGPAAETAPQGGERDPGTGRPTKQERRAIDRLLGGE